MEFCVQHLGVFNIISWALKGLGSPSPLALTPTAHSFLDSGLSHWSSPGLGIFNSLRSHCKALPSQLHARAFQGISFGNSNPAIHCLDLAAFYDHFNFTSFMPLKPVPSLPSSASSSRYSPGPCDHNCINLCVQTVRRHFAMVPV